MLPAPPGPSFFGSTKDKRFDGGAPVTAPGGGGGGGALVGKVESRVSVKGELTVS